MGLSGEKKLFLLFGFEYFVPPLDTFFTYIIINLSRNLIEPGEAYSSYTNFYGV